MNAATARSARRLTPWIVWGSLVIGWCIVFGPQVVTYVFGAETTAHVTRCVTSVSTDSNGNQTESVDCDGTWTLDGERHAGRVEGADLDQEGEDVAVRALGDRAAVATTPRTALLMTGFMLLLGAVTHTILWLRFTHAMRNPSSGRPIPR
ncbi:MAG: hypothetical protein GEV10_13520 [Streptosporangiales bacterium]|nr:hypothetical protein [Streptosporangiales bacterium]